MSVINAKKYLSKYNLEKEIITLPTSTATVEKASKSLSCNPDEIAKTLSFIVNDTPIVIVMSGNSRIDNAKYRNYFKNKAKMISPDLVESLIGHQVGGVCPFGVKDNVKIYLDNSLKKYEYVYPACGEANNAIKLTIPILEKILQYPKWIDVVK